MTGFGRAVNRSTQTDAVKSLDLDVAIRSINGRYLEMRFHLPREYAGLESEFKALLATRFSRGSVDIYINRVRASATGGAEVAVNLDLARKWLASYERLGQELKLKSAPSLETIVRIPEVLQVETQSEVSDEEKSRVKELLANAADACLAERVREGRALARELLLLCGRLESIAAEINQLKSDAKAELEKRYRERIREGLQKLGFEGKVDDHRIAQEIVIQIDRADISEEIQRLTEHLKVYRALLEGEESQGKKLDFYAQELLREVNTIGSKSHIARLTSLVVEAKTVVEKIREQVQNVE